MGDKSELWSEPVTLGLCWETELFPVSPKGQDGKGGGI